ncbi:S8 family peptidase [Aureimonas pseudogalii]|uniref:Peptidase S8/S53 domain-containing protein n=1 Tax=Aureimonas pseudogalii TaxID=1744844 RepID=A0A7W6EFW8_9HYPH|nr:S8 family peptidase [Aureimonas pseudogalii]MBB3997483.1 hypothetical protein [Aureimonas pseudogalii]
MVIETAWTLPELAAAARDAGFEWFAERLPERDDEPDEIEDDREAGGAVVYVTLPSAPALTTMLSKWRRYVAGEPRPSLRDRDPDGRWWDLFGYLTDVRTWSAKDRVDPSLAAYVARERERNPGAPVLVELDLWFRADEEERFLAEAEIVRQVGEMGGRITDRALIPEIEYHALMVEVTAEQAEGTARRTGALATAQALMTVKPQSVVRRRFPAEAEALPYGTSVPPATTGPAHAALLDGYPVASHTLLAGRVNVEEVDVNSAAAPIDTRYHGTAMASLILHGDLHGGGEPLASPLAVVPILASDDAGLETTPYGKLPMALVHRAVTALVEGLDGTDPLAPDVVVINHSVCDAEGPFVRQPSAWARLIDHLAYRHDLLFVVSAGNIETPFAIGGYASRAEAVAADELALQSSILNSLERSTGTRGILCPAEAVNALTVGAVHEDGSNGNPGAHHDPFPPFGMTNVGSAVGFGFNRSIKPDIVEAGGRQFVTIAENDDGAVYAFASDGGSAGQLAAGPDAYGGSNTMTFRSSGTSNAAALTTRAAVQVLELAREAFEESGEDWRGCGRRAVLLKALLVHGASWGRTGLVLDGSFPPAGVRQWSRRRQAIARFLGLGRPAHAEMTDAGAHRATLIAHDRISANELHEYRIPIPPSLVNNRELRRVTVTLCWTTDTRSTMAYRNVALDVVDKNGRRKFWKGVKAVPQPHPDAMRRGNTFHTVMEGENRIRTVDLDGIFLGVQARSLDGNGNPVGVPYALIVTLELAASSRSDVHTELRNAIRNREAARPRAGRE